MNMAVATRPEAAQIMERVLASGDLSKLTPAERNTYYNATCQSLGLNPLTRPFEYLTLSGKMVLYARRDAADQLRKINDISVTIVSRVVEEGICIVTARAEQKLTGRADEDMGAVNVGNLKGEFLANAILKAVTKAKRRVTLSICGLGFLDETEVEDIPEVRQERRQQRHMVDHTKPRAAIARSAQAPLPPHDAETGEISEMAEVASDMQAAEASISGEVVQERDWFKFGTEMTLRINKIENASILENLLTRNAAHLVGYKEWNPGKYQDLMALVAARKTELLNKETS